MASSFIKSAGIGTLSQAKRAVRIVVGFTVLFAGMVLLFLPGPAIIVIPVGLAILAGEFVWAKKLLARFNSHVNRAKNAITGNNRS